MSNTISGEMIVWFSVIIATIGWCVDCYIEDLCLNCNLYPDSAEVSTYTKTWVLTGRFAHRHNIRVIYIICMRYAIEFSNATTLAI